MENSPFTSMIFLTTGFYLQVLLGVWLRVSHDQMVKEVGLYAGIVYAAWL